MKNLIFAADGPKPEFVFSDALNNDLKTVKNAEYCLMTPLPTPLVAHLSKSAQPLDDRCSDRRGQRMRRAPHHVREDLAGVGVRATSSRRRLTVPCAARVRAARRIAGVAGEAVGPAKVTPRTSSC